MFESLRFLFYDFFSETRSSAKVSWTSVKTNKTWRSVARRAVINPITWCLSHVQSKLEHFSCRDILSSSQLCNGFSENCIDVTNDKIEPTGLSQNSIFSSVLRLVGCVYVCAGSPYLWLFYFRSIECWCVLTFRLALLHGGGGVHHCRLESTWCVWYIFDNNQRKRAPRMVEYSLLPDLSMFGTWLWIERKRTPSCALWCIWCVGARMVLHHQSPLHSVSRIAM